MDNYGGVAILTSMDKDYFDCKEANPLRISSVWFVLDI